MTSAEAQEMIRLLEAIDWRLSLLLFFVGLGVGAVLWISMERYRR